MWKNLEENSHVSHVVNQWFIPDCMSVALTTREIWIWIGYYMVDTNYFCLVGCENGK